MAQRVYVRLYSYISTGWQHTDYTYTASPGAKSALHLADTRFDPGEFNGELPMEIRAQGALERWLFVGSTVGGTQYHNSGTMAPGTLSRQVTGLPTNGSTVHVRPLHPDFKRLAVPLTTPTPPQQLPS